MSTTYTMLGLLRNQPSYGYELRRQYNTLFGKEKPILSGQVYASLARLKRDHKITQAHDDDTSGGPERIKYQITPGGRKAFTKWLATPEPPSHQLQATMYIKTVMALLQAGDAAPYLDVQRHAHLERMRQLTRQRRGSDLATKLLLDHQLYHLEADLRWMQMTSARLTNLKEELCQ